MLTQTKQCQPQNPFGEGQKADRAMDRLKTGDVTTAVNSMTEAPCSDCEQEKPSFFGGLSRKNFPKTHMVASVGNISCIQNNGQEESFNRFSVSSSSGNEKRRISKIIKSMAKVAGPSMANHLFGGVDVRFFEDLGNRKGTDYCIPAHQLRGYVSISRKCTKSYSTKIIDGLVIHEIGHYTAGRAGLCRFLYSNRSP